MPEHATHRSRRLTRDWVLTFGAEAAARIALAVILLSVGKWSGASALGIVSTSLVATSLALMVLEVGTGHGALQLLTAGHATEGERARAAGAAYALRVGLLVLSGAIAVATGGTLGTLVALGVWLAVLQNTQLFCWTIGSSTDNAARWAALHLASSAVLTTGHLMFGRSNLLIAPAATSVLTLLWLALLARSTPRARPGRSDVRRLVRTSVPYALSNLSAAAYFKLDVVLLAWLAGAASAGVYDAVYKFVTFALLPATALSRTLLPKWFRAHGRSDTSMRSTGHLLAGVGVLLVVGFRAVATLIERTLPSDSPVNVLMLIGVLPTFLVLRYFAAPAADSITAMGRQATRMRLMGAIAAVNVALNLLLIPRLGVWGAVVSTLCSETLLALTYVVLSARLSGRPVLRALVPAGVAVAALTVALLIPIGIASIAAFVVLLPAMLFFAVRQLPHVAHTPAAVSTS